MRKAAIGRLLRAGAVKRYTEPMKAARWVQYTLLLWGAMYHVAPHRPVAVPGKNVAANVVEGSDYSAGNRSTQSSHQFRPCRSEDDLCPFFLAPQKVERQAFFFDGLLLAIGGDRPACPLPPHGLYSLSPRAHPRSSLFSSRSPDLFLPLTEQFPAYRPLLPVAVSYRKGDLDGEVRYCVRLSGFQTTAMG